MCHAIVSGMEFQGKFIRLGLLSDNRLVGTKLIRVTENKEIESHYFYGERYLTNPVKINLFGGQNRHNAIICRTKNPIKKQDIELYIPVVTTHGREDLIVTKQVDAGMHIAPLLKTFTIDASNVDIPYRGTEFGTSKRRVLVIFKESDIIFYDGLSVSVREFYIPEMTTDLAEEIMNKMYNLKIIHQPIIAEYIKQTHELYEMLAKQTGEKEV